MLECLRLLSSLSPSQLLLLSSPRLLFSSPHHLPSSPFLLIPPLLSSPLLCFSSSPLLLLLSSFLLSSAFRQHSEDSDGLSSPGNKNTIGIRRITRSHLGSLRISCSFQNISSAVEEAASIVSAWKLSPLTLIFSWALHASTGEIRGPHLHNGQVHLQM